MQVLGAVLVVFLGYDILSNTVLLLQVFQGCCGGDLTLGVREEPTFGLDLLHGSLSSRFSDSNIRENRLPYIGLT